MFGVVIPVGPGDRELERLEAVVEELRGHEREEDLWLWIVDDAPRPRRITCRWPRLTVIRTAVREQGTPDLLSAHVAGTLEALAAIRDAQLEFAVKLDTDAAIIGGFSKHLRSAFSDLSLGVVGSYDLTSSGGTRDWSLWRSRINAADRPFAARRAGWRIRFVYRSSGHRSYVRAQRAAAYAVAPPGAHCLGGAYAVSGAFLRAASLVWEPWIGSGLGEDVTVGLLCSAAGLRMKSLTGPAEPFALAWRGLPADPSEVVAGGHSIVHSVKAHPVEVERAIREELQRLASSSKTEIGSAESTRSV